MRNIFTCVLLLFVSCNLIAQTRLADLSRLITGNANTLSITRNPDELLRNRVPGTPVLVLPKKDTTKTIIRMRCHPIRNQIEPLVVVDGTIMEMPLFSRIDINTIGNIAVLKGNEALAVFGALGTAGVIIITTKGQALKALLIRDFLDGTVIPGATVSFISYDKRDTLMYVADSAGQVRTDKLKMNKGWSVNVTSSGYRSFTGLLSYNKKQEILLERDFKTGPEVIVRSVQAVGCRTVYESNQFYGDIRCGRHWFTIIDSVQVDRQRQLNTRICLTSYPNPIKRGQQLNVRLMSGVFPEGLLKVLSLDGRLLMSAPVGAGKNQELLQLSTDQRWTAGIYLLQLVYANGKVGASEKIIIQ